VSTFKITGGGFDSVKAYVRMFAPKYRLKNWTTAYDAKTKVSTVKVEYYSGNMNTAKPDAIVKSEEELKQFLFGYTKGKSEHQIYLTNNNTLDPTTDQMFIIKLDYTVPDWATVRKTIASVDFTYRSRYRLLLHGIHTRYNHEYLPVTVNYGWSAEYKAYYEKYIGEVVKEIQETSKSPYEKIYKWFTHSYEYSYDYAKDNHLEYQNYLIMSQENRKAYYGSLFDNFVDTYIPENDKPLLEDKTGVTDEFLDLNWYVLSELDIDNLKTSEQVDNKLYGISKVFIGDDDWFIDYPNKNFISEENFPFYINFGYILPCQNIKFKEDIKTYDQFKEYYDIIE